jgi:uncharacterized protein (DUF58 family)
VSGTRANATNGRVTLPPEILKKVKLLEISTRKLVNNLFAGEYNTAFRGQGMTFAEFREYEPGDDVRAISWPLTARHGKPFIKKFEEERELTLMLIVDVSGSGNFGTGEYIKGEVIAHLAAVLGFAAAKSSDPIGLILFSDQIEHFVPPKKGRGHVYRILRDLYYHRPRSQRTNIKQALEYAQGVLKKKSTVFVFSDFIDKGFDESLRLLSRKHDTVAVVVEDKAERDLPNLGLVDLQDPETGEIVTVDTSSPTFRRDFLAESARVHKERDALLKKAQVEKIDVLANEDIVDPLIAYFKKRNRR